MLTKIVFLSVVGFLSGSLLFAQLLPKTLYGIDIISKSKNGNPGTANVFLICGKKCGILTAILEFAKGFFPVMMGNIMIPPESRTFMFGFVIMAPVMGHIFSIFHHGNGGMGIATTFGTLIAVFLQCKVLILLVADYAIGKFLLKFRHNYQRTLFVFGIFIAELVIINCHNLYTGAYFLISCVIIIKCLFTMLTHPAESKGKDRSNYA